ncbi:putative sensor histidine kinase, partial [Vibrio parahaemolyticus AQ3810]
PWDDDGDRVRIHHQIAGVFGGGDFHCLAGDEY